MTKRSLARALVMVAMGALAMHGVSTALGAEGPIEADVILPDCPAAALDARALFAALALELEHDGIRRVHQVAAQSPDAVTTIEAVIDCHAEAVQVRLRVRHARQQAAQRTMDMADLPRRLRVRAVALAAAELARSTWSGAVRIETAPADDAGAEARPAVASDAEDRKAIPPSPPRPTATPESAKAPHESAAVSPAARPRRRWGGFGVGATARWFLPAASPSFGGRAAVRIDRLQAGCDVLYGYASRFANRPTLALAVGWISVDALAREREGWRLSTGPRLAAGAGWASPSAISQESTLGGPVPGSVEAESPTTETRGWYLEGALIAELRARTARGWMIALEMAAGLGWGTAPGRDSARPSLRPNLGASLLAGHNF